MSNLYAQDYFPFGSVMDGRSYNNDKYRFGFNGQERDSDLGEYYIFEARVHDTRLGRFLSVDPLAPEYPWNSTYAFAENRVLDGIDLEGKEWSSSTEEVGNKIIITITVDLKLLNLTKRMGYFRRRKLLKKLDKEFSSSFDNAGRIEGGKSIEFKSQINATFDKDAKGDYSILLIDPPKPKKKGSLTISGHNPSLNSQKAEIPVNASTWLEGERKKGKDIDKIAHTIIHEIGHGILYGHPSDENHGAEDVSLIKAPYARGYISGEKAKTELILSNVMNYGWNVYNGKRIDEQLPDINDRNSFSPDQAKQAIKKIDADKKKSKEE